MKDRIRQILEKYPNLTYCGFEAFAGTKEQRSVFLEKGQKELLEHTDEIEYVVNWLAGVRKTKTINHGYSSYRLKHIAEKTFPKGYIANGSFIVGAIIAGFDFKTSGINAYFDISYKSLKLKLKEKILEGVELETNIS